MAELINSLVNDILHTVPTLLVSPHASPVIRLLLLVLTPNRALPSLDAGDAAGGADLVRSKRSGKWRKGQGVQGKSILGDDEDKGKSRDSETRRVPTDVVELRAKIRHEVSSRLSPMEWHGMGVDKVGSAAVQLLLEVEVEDGEAEKEGSVLDIITEGLITHLGQFERPGDQTDTRILFGRSTKSPAISLRHPRFTDWNPPIRGSSPTSPSTNLFRPVVDILCW